MSQGNKFFEEKYAVKYGGSGAVNLAIENTKKKGKKSW